MQTQLLNEINSVLKEFPQYWDDNVLKRYEVITAIENKEPELIKALISNDKLKQQYSTDIDGILLFDFNKLVSLIQYKEYWQDSFTKYKNKIGLTAEGNYLDYNTDVVLDFPFKDCVLEGGMSKAEVGKEEIYYHEIIAADEIDRLTQPKVLTNAKHYSVDGVETNNNEIKASDNLIIKGNNLIALHTLNQRYHNAIKLIYIDPPYCTGDDSFLYNDKFTRSTYLTFMKNRLEIAKELLCDTGVIMVQCSFHQFAYLKVLMNDIFPKSLVDFNILVRHPDRTLTGDKEFNDVVEYLMVYAKKPSMKMPVKEEIKTVDDYNIDIDLVQSEVPETIELNGKEVQVYLPHQYTIKKVEPNENALKKISVRGSIREKNSSGRFFVKYLEGLTNYPPQTLFKVPNMGDDNREYRYFYSAPAGRKNGGYYQGKPVSSDTTNKPYPNFIDFVQQYNDVAEEGGVSFRNGKKPEELLYFLISIFTKPGDIVVDYHLGSGTTAAVAHKMGRQYIGIEQMDYIEELAVQRLQNVINGEQTGISEQLDWQGGGSFVYCELAKLNQNYVDEILKAESTEQLLSILEVMKAEAYLNYQVQLDKLLNTKIEKEGVEHLVAFPELTLAEQKTAIKELLDKNQLYINVSEIDDVDMNVSVTDKQFTKSFYQKGM